MTNAIILIFVIVLSGIVFNLEARRTVKERRMRRAFNLEEGRRGFGPDSAFDNLPYSEETGAGKAGQTDLACDGGIARTIELIGKEEYSKMTARIEDVIDRHRGQNCTTVSLTCGPDTFDGAHELHRLLPGQPLNLVSCSAGGVDTIDVYFNGARIGRLALADEEKVRDILNGSRMTGAYVAEQNCYGLIGSHRMELIIFTEPLERRSRLSKAYTHALRMLATRRPVTENICQN